MPELKIKQETFTANTGYLECRRKESENQMTWK